MHDPQMDLGVGSFVFSQGLVSAIPVLKNPAHLSAPVMPKLVQVARKVSPLIVLGLVRVLLVKGTEYPVRLHLQLPGQTGFTEIFSCCIGTRHRIWCTLEFFHHFSIATAIIRLYSTANTPPAYLTPWSHSYLG